jgi:hypothetical protein
MFLWISKRNSLRCFEAEAGYMMSPSRHYATADDLNILKLAYFVIVMKHQEKKETLT